MRAGIRISSLVPSGLVIESVSDSSDSIILAVRSEAGMAECPLCVNRPFNCGLLSSTLLNLPVGKVVALAQSELVGIVETGRARLACDCQLDIGHLVIN